RRRLHPSPRRGSPDPMTEWSVRLPGNVGGDDAEGSRPASGSETFAIEDSLGYLLNRTARLMANELAERLRPAGVAIGQWAVLLFLWARDGLSQAELSRLVAIEPPTMVRTIDRMVRDGLVIRMPDSDVGRGVGRAVGRPGDRSTTDSERRTGRSARGRLL